MDRVQRKREKGYRLPPNTLVVTRGTPFGNQWQVRKTPKGWLVTDGIIGYLIEDEDMAYRMAVLLFQDSINSRVNLMQLFVDICENRGIEHVACFCPVDMPCHGDVWLEVWNEYKKG